MFPDAATAKRPSLFKLVLEGRALIELTAFYAAFPFLQTAARGDGHPVLILPGYMADDLSTLPLRTYLKSRGYAPHGWKLGRNLGRDTDLVQGVSERILQRLDTLWQQYGCKISLIGWSLGGIYARELARLRPDFVRQVITLGSPFNGDFRANNVSRFYEMSSGHALTDLDPQLMARMKRPLPVPTTAIYSRMDGITAWECCLVTPAATSENIEVKSSHCGFGFHPQVLWIIANRLKQPEDSWQPYQRQ